MQVLPLLGCSSAGNAFCCVECWLPTPRCLPLVHMPLSDYPLLQRRVYKLTGASQSNVRLVHYNRAGSAEQQPSQAPASRKRKTPEPGDDEQASWQRGTCLVAHLVAEHT